MLHSELLVSFCFLIHTSVTCQCLSTYTQAPFKLTTVITDSYTSVLKPVSCHMWILLCPFTCMYELEVPAERVAAGPVNHTQTEWCSSYYFISLHVKVMNVHLSFISV